MTLCNQRTDDGTICEREAERSGLCVDHERLEEMKARSTFRIKKGGSEFWGGRWRSPEEMKDIRDEAQLDASYERQERGY
jgi:hypothetical protein